MLACILSLFRFIVILFSIQKKIPHLVREKHAGQARTINRFWSRLVYDFWLVGLRTDGSLKSLRQNFAQSAQEGKKCWRRDASKLSLFAIATWLARRSDTLYVLWYLTTCSTCRSSTCYTHSYIHSCTHTHAHVPVIIAGSLVPVGTCVGLHTTNQQRMSLVDLHVHAQWLMWDLSLTCAHVKLP